MPSRFELILSSRAASVGPLQGVRSWSCLVAATLVVTVIAIFTFIFAGIFGARFGVSASPWDYAIHLFCGLLPWTMFQEAVAAIVNDHCLACQSGEARCVSTRNAAHSPDVVGPG